MAGIFSVSRVLKQNERKSRWISSDPYVSQRTKSLEFTFQLSSGAIITQISDVNPRHLAPKCRYFKVVLGKPNKCGNEQKRERAARHTTVPCGFTKVPGRPLSRMVLASTPSLLVHVSRPKMADGSKNFV